MTDPAELKRALEAFKKRLKVMRQDDESTLGGGPFSRGKTSSLAGIRPPPGFAPEIWEELVEAGRLRREPGGTYSMAPQK